MFEEGIVLKAKYGEENVFDFTLGNPFVNPPPQFSSALARVAVDERDGIHAYMQNPGFPAVREKVARELAEEFGLPFESRHILMTVGAAGASNVILKSILNPGDEVILFKPFFPEYAFYIDNHRGVVVKSQTNPDCLPDPEDLESRITARTRVVMINTPCNPTGRIVPSGVLDEIANVLRRKSLAHGRPIVLLSDEPYRKLIYDNAAYPAPVRHYEHTIIAMSHSKDISLAGERIGYMAISPNCDDAANIHAAATFSNRVLGYVNAPALMQRVLLEMDKYDSNVPEYQRKRDRLYNALTSIGYVIPEVEGTFFMFPESPVADDQAFVRILADEKILVTPGSGFDGPGHFRISFAVGDRVIEGALPGFERAFQKAKMISP